MAKINLSRNIELPPDIKEDANGIRHYGKKDAAQMLEKNLQIQTYDLLRWKFKDVYATHIANERIVPHAGTVKSLIRQGMQPGFSDWLILYRGKPYFIELKVKGGRMSENQIAFLKTMKELGFIAVVVWNFDAFKWVVQKYIIDGKPEGSSD